MARKKTKNQAFVKVMMILLFLVGSLIMLYPFYIDALNDLIDQRRMEHYQKKEKAEYEAQQRQLIEANEKLAATGLSFGADPFGEVANSQISQKEYEEHLIGQVNIPKLALDIPLFDTTTPSFLEAGATVINGTSYPVGGAGTHAVISAHRGLPERELFTNLPKLEAGDLFLLKVLGETLAYEVQRIEVVEPDETSSLKIVPDADLVTLVTCTPYMINSHRLLVTGHRVPYTPAVAKVAAKGDRFRKFKQMAILLGMLGLIFGGCFILFRVIQRERLKKVRFDLSLNVPELRNQTLQLSDSKGKTPLLRKGNPFIIQVDNHGEACFSNIPGGVYRILILEQKKQFKAGIKRSGQQPKVYSKIKKTRTTFRKEKVVFES
ncbi:class C sortase [Enterococcus sp. LJL98]